LRMNQQRLRMNLIKYNATSPPDNRWAFSHQLRGCLLIDFRM
jgi:hypothetical protein